MFLQHIFLTYTLCKQDLAVYYKNRLVCMSVRAIVLWSIFFFLLGTLKYEIFHKHDITDYVRSFSLTYSHKSENPVFFKSFEYWLAWDFYPFKGRLILSYDLVKIHHCECLYILHWEVFHIWLKYFIQYLYALYDGHVYIPIFETWVFFLFNCYLQ